MMMLTVRPDGTKAEQYDGVAGTYTAWDESGRQTVSRPLTTTEAATLAAQDAAAARAVNEGDLRGKLTAAVGANRTYLGLATPTAAQTTAQARSLTRQVIALELLLLGTLDDTSGT